MNSPDLGIDPDQRVIKQVEMLLRPHLLTGHYPHFPQSYNLFQETDWRILVKFQHKIRENCRKTWSENKNLDRLFRCLTEKALEYAVKCKNNTSYENLNGELKLRFDSSDEPVPAPQKLHLAKQSDDETLEVYMQRILSIATDGFGDFDNAVMQQIAIEAFLRGCQNKEAASFILVSTPSTIQDACRKMKMFIANKKAVDGNKCSFQESLFTAQEEKRVSDLERKVSHMTYMIRSRSPQRPYTSSYRYPRDGQSYDRYRQNRRENNTRSDRYSPSPSRSPPDQYRDRYKTPFYGHQQQGGGRYPSQSPSNSSTRGSSGERYNSSGRILPEDTPHPTDTPDHLMGLERDTNALDKTDIVRTIALRNKLHAIDLQNPKAVQNQGRLSHTISLGECHRNTGTLKI